MPRVNFDDLEYDDDGLVLHEGVLFTGDAFELHPDGALQWEGSYRSGRLHGVGREYYQTGEPKSEQVFTNGVSDGIGHEWSPDGALLTETHHARGILLKRSQRGEDGLMRVTFELTRDHPNYSLLTPELRARIDAGAGSA
jgi:hypothetical protein